MFYVLDTRDNIQYIPHEKKDSAEVEATRKNIHYCGIEELVKPIGDRRFIVKEVDG